MPRRGDAAKGLGGDEKKFRTGITLGDSNDVFLLLVVVINEGYDEFCSSWRLRCNGSDVLSAEDACQYDEDQKELPDHTQKYSYFHVHEIPRCRIGKHWS